MRIILVHNTGAGDGIHDRTSLLRLMAEHGHEAEYFAATDDWRSHARPPVDLAVAAGGDGTVADLARYLAGSGIPIGVLPMGTANNIAHTLGIARAPIPELVARWETARRQPFDTGMATGQGEPFRFIESVGAGLLAESIAEITEGSSGYVDELDHAHERKDAAIDVLRDTLRRMTPTHVDLSIDGRPISGEYLLVEVMNFGWAGPNLCLTPGAAHADGLFDVVLADVSHRASLIDDLPDFVLGNRPVSPLPVHQGRHVMLNADEYRLHFDDQLRVCHGRLDLTVEPRALTFLV